MFIENGVCIECALQLSFTLGFGICVINYDRA